MTTMPTDDDLIARTRQGDAAAYAELIDRHQDRLRMTLAYYCHHADSREEYVQEAFVQAYLSLHTFHAGAEFFPWLRTIAINALRKEARRAAVIRSNADDYLRSFHPAPIDQDALGLEADRRGLALSQCVEQLPGPSRRLILAHYRDQALAQVSSESAVDIGTLRVRLLRIRNALRECVERRLRIEPA